MLMQESEAKLNSKPIKPLLKVMIIDLIRKQGRASYIEMLRYIKSKVKVSTTSIFQALSDLKEMGMFDIVPDISNKRFPYLIKDEKKAEEVIEEFKNNVFVKQIVELYNKYS